MLRHAFELPLRIDELIMRLTEIAAYILTSPNVYFLTVFFVSVNGATWSRRDGTCFG
jgi:hypothetical protein